MKTTRFFGLALLALSSCFTYAWNGTGHEVVAAIAWKRLDHGTKVEIARILLAGDTVTGRSRNGEAGTPNAFLVKPSASGAIDDAYLEGPVRDAFVKASTWADAIKGGESQNYEADIKALNDASPEVDKASPSERTRCKSWHYIDLPIRADDDVDFHEPIKSNAIYAIAEARKNLVALEAGQDSKKQALWLYFLEHIVGDMHQPLHCVSNFIVDKAEGDAGGNKFKLAEGNLHSYWDSGVDHAKKADSRLTSGQRNTSVADLWLTDTADQPTEADYKDLDPMDWAKKGRQLALDDVYLDLPQGQAPSDAYTAKQAVICKKQVLLAGYRLAEILNHDLKHS